MALTTYLLNLQPPPHLRLAQAPFLSCLSLSAPVPAATTALFNLPKQVPHGPLQLARDCQPQPTIKPIPHLRPQLPMGPPPSIWSNSIPSVKLFSHKMDGADPMSSKIRPGMLTASQLVQIPMPQAPRQLMPMPILRLLLLQELELQLQLKLKSQICGAKLDPPQGTYIYNLVEFNIILIVFVHFYPS